MKKVLLCFCVSLLTQEILAQDYHPFPEEQAVWHIATWDDGCPIPFPCQFNEYYFNGDTVLDTYLYHKLYYRFEFQGNVSTYSLEGMIRQDSLQKKVYYFPLTGIHEYLLYDFNLTEGEWYPLTYNHGLAEGGDSFLVYKIDSILLNDGYRKRYRLLPPVYSGDTVSVIEGIGATSGLFNGIYHYLGWEHYSLLLCFQENAQTVYDPYGDEYCTILSIDDISSENLKVTIVPNPVKKGQQLKITSESNQVVRIEIRDLLGSVLKEKTDETSEFKIDTDCLPKGILVIRIFLKNETILIRKIIIQ